MAETILRCDGLTFRHTHDFYEVFLITNGKVTHFVNGKEIPMGLNSLSMAGPGDVHQFQKGNVSEAHFINIAFSPDTLSKAIELYSSYGTVWDWHNPVRTVQLPSALGQVLLLKANYLGKSSPKLFRLSAKEALMGLLMDCLCFLQNSSVDEVIAPSWLLEACNAMRKEENYLKGLPQFVSIAGKRQEHLTRSMKRYYNTTPSAYLNGIKLEQAAFLLRTTEQAVLDILLQCGFNNVSHFNRLFRDKYGATPIRYRHLNRIVISPTCQ